MRVALRVAYDGTRFSGNQVQPDGVRTVHGELARALAAMGEPETRLSWAGRTDAGVSAVGNVVVLETALAPASLLAGLTFRVDDAWAWAWAEVDAAFEPRHARRRRYRYHLRSDLDASEMRAAMAPFLGTHDFTSFARIEPNVNPVRTVERVEVQRRGPYLLVDVEGPNFLYNQVRRMVEAARRVAAGELRRDDLAQALREPGSADLGVAPPEPLVLLDVQYGGGVRFEPFSEPDRLFERLRRRLDRAELETTLLHTLHDGARGA